MHNSRHPFAPSNGCSPTREPPRDTRSKITVSLKAIRAAPYAHTVHPRSRTFDRPVGRPARHWPPEPHINVPEPSRVECLLPVFDASDVARTCNAYCV